MRYVLAKFKQKNDDQAYRIYVTDALYASGNNKAMSKRYFELIKPEMTCNRSGDDVALDVIKRLGLKVV